MANKTDLKKIEKEAVKLAEKTLTLLGIKAGVKTKSEGQVVRIDIEGEDLGLLIGYRGENLESLQLFLGLALNNKLQTDSWLPVLVDVGGWRSQREESLKTFVEKEITKFSDARQTVELPPMPPAQRRTAHLIVADHEGLVSESEGEGLSRHVVIKKASEGK